jgi:ubiquinone/menaquinone biosynthesis C-methylase UbiE
LNYLARQLDPGQPTHVLEIGPGPGWIGIQLAQSHPAVQVTGIDISAAFVMIANENSRREGVADRVTFTLGDATQMEGLADDSFDAVFSNQSFHYWDPPECVLNQIARVLKPSGVFCIGDDHRDMNWQGRLHVLLGAVLPSPSHQHRLGTIRAGLLYSERSRRRAAAIGPARSMANRAPAAIDVDHKQAEPVKSSK